MIPTPSLVRTVAEGLAAGDWAVVWSLKEESASHLTPGELCQEYVGQDTMNASVDTPRIALYGQRYGNWV